MRKALKYCKKNEDEKKTRIGDEATCVSTISTYAGRSRAPVLPIPIPIHDDIADLSTPATTRVTIVAYVYIIPIKIKNK